MALQLLAHVRTSMTIIPPDYVWMSGQDCPAYKTSVHPYKTSSLVLPSLVTKLQELLGYY